MFIKKFLFQLPPSTGKRLRRFVFFEKTNFLEFWQTIQSQQSFGLAYMYIHMYTCIYMCVCSLLHTFVYRSKTFNRTVREGKVLRLEQQPSFSLTSFLLQLRIVFVLFTRVASNRPPPLFTPRDRYIHLLPMYTNVHTCMYVGKSNLSDSLKFH